MFQARDVIARTVEAAQTIFIGDPTSSGPGLFMQAVSEMQQDATSQDDNLIPSASKLMKLLPSSTYLSALPSSIKAFRPIFDLSSNAYSTPKDVLQAQIYTWIDTTLGETHGPLQALFRSADSIRAVWSLQKQLSLDGKDNAASMTLHRTWNRDLGDIARSQTITLWQRYLAKMKTEFQRSLEDAKDNMAEGAGDGESRSLPIL